MIIKENDFKIIFKDGCYTLYLLKNKKEKKEDPDDFKIGGYYTTITSLIKKIISFRSSKKYSGKESITNLTKILNQCINIHSQLIESLKLKDEPIYKLIEDVKRDKNLL